ncbi:hypothetical protein [Aeromicrobium sp.]|uniref:hypothetical protein n=1 Tax=Aeromicrobium sp. TaxID=1871063 RepID=UPI0028B0C4F2|nr:hypothetical protein [Aeromicrobium sp.]
MDDIWTDHTDRRSRAELDELLRYGHFISVGKGYTQAYVRLHFPGWEWNDLITMLRMGGVIQKQPGDMLRCRRNVMAVRFGGSSRFDVEWDWLAT